MISILMVDKMLNYSDQGHLCLLGKTGFWTSYIYFCCYSMYILLLTSYLFILIILLQFFFMCWYVLCQCQCQNFLYFDELPIFQPNICVWYHFMVGSSVYWLNWCYEQWLPFVFLGKCSVFCDFPLLQVVVSLLQMCILFLHLSEQWRTLRLLHLPSGYDNNLLALLQVIEKDLAIFGFFIALGRSTQSFLSANGVSAMDNQIEGIIRCPMLLEYL